MLFVPGVPYILTSKSAAGELSSGVCVREKAINHLSLIGSEPRVIPGQPRNGFGGLALIARA
jgi:hypothetical protein